MRFKSLVVLLIVLLVGCSSGTKEEISKDDLAIVKVGDKNAVVKYDMSRADAEKVLGKGEKLIIGESFAYNSGVKIMYRNEKVAGISLTDESADAYEAVSGLKIGILKDEIKKIYGDKYLVEHEENLDYAYSSESKQFLKESELPKTEEGNLSTYMISARFDDNGYVDSIMLLDRQMAMFMK